MHIIESQYFPVIDWFKIFSGGTNVRIEQYETFQKMSFRNRCIISGSNGLVNLSVPLQNGREQKAPIHDIRIDNTQAWQKQHWKSIVSSYSRSPFFEYFGEGVNRLLSEKQVFLFDLNFSIIKWLTNVLEMPVSVGLTDTYVKNYNPDNVFDYRNKWLPKNFQAEGAQWMPRYTQVFENKFGFIPNLSILDLLFCKGSF